MKFETLRDILGGILLTTLGLAFFTAIACGQPPPSYRVIEVGENETVVLVRGGTAQVISPNGNSPAPPAGTSITVEQKRAIRAAVSEAAEKVSNPVQAAELSAAYGLMARKIESGIFPDFESVRDQQAVVNKDILGDDFGAWVPLSDAWMKSVKPLYDSGSLKDRAALVDVWKCTALGLADGAGAEQMSAINFARILKIVEAIIKLYMEFR